MWSLLFPLYDDELIALLWEAGTAGLVEDENGLRAFFEDDVDRANLAHLHGEFRREKNEPNLPSDDWEPIPIGLNLLIVPSSFGKNAPSDRLLLPLQPGAAFGTGRHETTQLCLEALERFLRPADSVLDVGCGSAILSVAARLLGAGRVVSCDIEEQAVWLAQRQDLPAFRGSADAVASSVADLTVANLTAEILDLLAWDLHRVTKPGGRILLSGFMHDGPPRSFTPEHALNRAGWLCWLCRPETVRASAPPAEGLSHRAEWWLSS